MDKFTFTFQATTIPGSVGDSARDKPKNNKRITTSNACTECRRRKIRCDGAKPCSQCQWYQQQDACHYSKPAQRVVPSRKLLDELTASVSQHEALIGRLFPGQGIEDLLPLPQDELLSLAHTLQSASASVPCKNDPSPHGVNSLEVLEQAPDQDSEQDESRRQLDTGVQRISDDVNGLSLSVDKQASYVGASSITAALKVIFKVAPGARYLLARTEPYETALPPRSTTPSLFRRVDIDTEYLPPAHVGSALIEAYFNRIHTLMPMIDEQQFWHHWLHDNRKDSSWLALLNTVFALGSLALSDAHSDQHTIYFHRAKRHIDVETLGSSNIMVVQALGLLSGYYLHYVNRPNLANNLMGATLRMATVMGLHREFQRPPVGGPSSSTLLDTRRRTWWSLCCLDAWAGITTGRPSLGRLGPGVTTQPPENPVKSSHDSQYLISLRALPLVHNAAFCRLSTRIQDALATAPLLTYDELVSLDTELLTWHDNLPSTLVPPEFRRLDSLHKQPAMTSLGRARADKTSDTAKADPRVSIDFSRLPEHIRDQHLCPDFLQTTRAIMHWRYQNLGIVLLRPSLLAAALGRTPLADLAVQEVIAVEKCRHVAAQAIQDINDMCPAELIAGWNGVWFMYQAVMVPLVSLFSHLSLRATVSTIGLQASSPNEDVEAWKQQISTAISFFERMTQWSIAATKSRDVVARLYEVANTAAQHHLLVQHANSREHSPTKYGGARATAHDDPSNSRLAELPNLTQGPANTWNGQQAGNPDPPGDAAFESFWQELQWDSAPIFTGSGQDTSMMDAQGNAGTGYALADFDWFQGTENLGDMP